MRSQKTRRPETITINLPIERRIGWMWRENIVSPED